MRNKTAYLKHNHIPKHIDDGKEERYHEPHRVCFENEKVLFLQHLSDEEKATPWAIVDKSTNIVYSTYSISYKFQDIEQISEINFSAKIVIQATAEGDLSRLNIYSVAKLISYEEYRKAQVSFYREKLDEANNKLKKLLAKTEKYTNIILGMYDSPRDSYEPRIQPSNESYDCEQAIDFKIGERVIVKDEYCGFVKSISKLTRKILVEVHERCILTDWFYPEDLKKVEEAK